MQRAGHVVLDGVDDPNSWISYKVVFDALVVKSAPHLLHQFLHSSLVDAEKTYSGLTDGCAAGGRAGCKLVEITGDGASGDDVKNLINDAHDVIEISSQSNDSTDPLPPQVALELYRAGYEVPANPGFLKCTNSILHFTNAWLLISRQIGSSIFCTSR